MKLQHILEVQGGCRHSAKENKKRGGAGGWPLGSIHQAAGQPTAGLLVQVNAPSEFSTMI